MRTIMTFLVGYHSCQGQALAQAEMSEILYCLISMFEFGIMEKGEPQSVPLFKPVSTYLFIKKAI